MTSKPSALLDAALNNLKGLASAGLFSIWLAGKPVPAGRPRVTKFGTFYPKTYRDWIKANTPVIEKLEAHPTTDPVALVVEVICPPLKGKTDQVAPMGDVDNFAKGPMDLLTKLGKAWKDDRQIVSLTTVKRWAGKDEEPGFRLWWCSINGRTDPSNDA